MNDKLKKPVDIIWLHYLCESVDNNVYDFVKLNKGNTCISTGVSMQYTETLQMRIVLVLRKTLKVKFVYKSKIIKKSSIKCSEELEIVRCLYYRRISSKDLIEYV